MNEQLMDGKAGRDLVSPAVLEVPSQHWLPDHRASRAQVLERLRELGNIFQKGSAALGGLYLRLCAHVREYGLTPEETRAELRACGMSDCRISEILRVAGAPPGVWMEYSARLVGFRVALSKTRLYYMVGRKSMRYRKRQLQRVGVRLVKRLTGLGLCEWRFTHGAWVLFGLPVTEYNKHCALVICLWVSGPVILQVSDS